MSDIVFKSHAHLKSPASHWLRAAIEWLSQARVAARLPLESVDDLSDRQLRDIGGERRNIAKTLDRELGQIGLLGSGWQRRR